MRRATWWVAAALPVWVMASCGSDEASSDETVAVAEPVVGPITIGAHSGLPAMRVSRDETIRAAAGGLTRVTLDGGARLLLAGVAPHAELVIRGPDAVELLAGRLYLEVEERDLVEVTTRAGNLRVGDAAVSIELGARGAEADAYVVRGEVAYTTGNTRGAASAGQRARLGAGRARVEPASLWTDWTGGLARPGPHVGDRSRGVGVLEARVPDEIGLARWPLVIRRLDVRVVVHDDQAITEVDQIFFNPASEAVEGYYRFQAPAGAVLQRFAVDRSGRLVDGYVREQQQARAAYQAQVYRGSTDDPALLEWIAPGSYRARIYPIPAGATRRIVVRYVEWLTPRSTERTRQYRYPMGSSGSGAPRIQELSLAVDVAQSGAARVRAGLGATIDPVARTVSLRRSDFRPRADFWLDLEGAASTDRAPATAASNAASASSAATRAYRAPYSPPRRAPGSRTIVGEADERDFFLLPVVVEPPSTRAPSATRGIDLVIVADASAGTDRSQLELGRSVVESLVAHLGPDDRVAIVTSDLAIRAIGGTDEPRLGPSEPARITALLDALARTPAGGATDLGEALGQAAALLDPAREGAVVYVGDGAPTVGELGSEELLTRMSRLPSPPRLYAVAIGQDAQLDLLESLVGLGGLALRVEERTAAADGALRILAHAHRPVVRGVTVRLGSGIDAVYPRRAVDVVAGEALVVMGRVRGDVPRAVVVEGTSGGRPFRTTVNVETRPAHDRVDLRLRWASERLRHLLGEGEGRETVAELGTRYGLITPYTSYYVPSEREMREMGESASLLLDSPPLQIGARRLTTPAATRPSARNVFAYFGFLSMTACTRSAPAPAAENEAHSAADDEGGRGRRHRSDEGRMGAASPTKSGGSENEPSSPEPSEHTARDQAREAAQNIGILGTLRPTTGAAQEAPAAAPPPLPSPMDRDTAAGTDPMAALGALLGDQMGASMGAGGLGTGGGGTGDGTIGLGNLGTIGRGAGGGSGSGYGRGAGGFASRTASVPRVRTGTARVTGSLSTEIITRVIRRHINEVRFCYERELAQRPGLSGRVEVRFVIAPTGTVQSASVASSTLSNDAVERCITAAVRRWTFPVPDGGGIVVVTYPFSLATDDGEGPIDGRRRAPPRPPVTRYQAPAPAAEPAASGAVSTNAADTSDVIEVEIEIGRERGPRTRCSEASRLPLEDRRALWRERLGQDSGAAAYVGVYRGATRQCETPTWRDRRALLALVLDRAGDVSTMVDVYRALARTSVAAFLRASISRRVRSPADLRAVRDAFGLGAEPDWALVEQTLARATTADAKVRVLRALLAQHPASFPLKLRLLAAFEDARRLPEARRLADAMRVDPTADAAVRTAIGEMFLRTGERDEARRVFSEIVEFAPLDELARRRLGDLYRAHGWSADAYRQYRTLATIRPDDPTVSLLLAQAAAGAGRVDEALRLEQTLSETAEPGGRAGLARTAVLSSSVRFAKLRADARQATSGGEGRLAALVARMRRSGVLRESSALRVALTWSHPDAQLSLWASHPTRSLARPADIAPELGIEVFDVREQEPGVYRIEVRRRGDRRTTITAELVLVWNEGQPDEQVIVVPLRFDAARHAFAWTIEGRTHREATPTPERTELANVRPAARQRAER